MIDTHSHIYGEEFDLDREQVIERALEQGLEKIVLANVDNDSLPRIIKTCEEYPSICIPTIGLHPTSVDDNFQSNLDTLFNSIDICKWFAIGEIGLDLYWDTKYREQQIIAFEQQIEIALRMNLPVIVHIRNAFEDLHNVMSKYKNRNLSGVIHSFSGDVNDVDLIKSFGNFYFGINGIVTFKKSELKELIPIIGIENIILETDSPYLSPVPYRGKRNESSYVVKIAEEIARTLDISLEEVNRITTKNAEFLFSLT
ncbi:MAG: TatD family hydrolase [Bacteroidales bacterium]|nr:TatD family hydrolase [Bacteroidales bacterium]